MGNTDNIPSVPTFLFDFSEALAGVFCLNWTSNEPSSRAATHIHGLSEGDRNRAARSDGVSAPQCEPPRGTALVGGAGAAVEAEVGELEGHLDEAVRAELVRLSVVFAEGGQREGCELEIGHQAAERDGRLIRVMAELPWLNPSSLINLN